MAMKGRLARLSRREQAPRSVGTGRGRQERGEPLWPVLAALVVAIILPFLLPSDFRSIATWVMTSVEIILLVAMVVLDPGRIDGHSVLIRRVRVSLIAVLVTRSAIAAVTLTAELVTADPSLNTSSELFSSGAVVWLGLVISFAFLYWEMDSGGPGMRANAPIIYPDIAFPQQLNPEVRPPGWKPRFGDYLYLGVTTGMAFSPTDAMPLTRWVKLAMAVESLTSLMVIGLVIARAINVLQ